jgi:hypothetical protein
MGFEQKCGHGRRLNDCPDCCATLDRYAIESAARKQAHDRDRAANAAGGCLLAALASLGGR